MLRTFLDSNGKKKNVQSQPKIRRSYKKRVYIACAYIPYIKHRETKEDPKKKKTSYRRKSGYIVINAIITLPKCQKSISGMS